MAYCEFCHREHNVGFVSTRFAGTDGVSLETEKWAQLFEKEGLNCFYFGGELDRSSDISYQLAEAHFTHPDILKITRSVFGVKRRDRAVTQKIHKIKIKIKDHLYSFIEKYKIDLLVPENSLTIPLNIPLGLAITEVISETGISTIAHHHDFFWERQQFITNACWDYINMAFPPQMPAVKHVVINSVAGHQLSHRTGISATLIPNVMDFENPSAPPDDYALDVRDALGIEPNELLILQPTRVVKRKGIEHAIELAHRLGSRAKLIISHASGDEGHDYEKRVRDYSKLMGVNTLFVSDIINDRRGTTADGRKVYTLSDIYPFADLVTYPSTYEGFGNAFLEAVYFRKPIVVNNYSIYSADIKPKGFNVIEIDGYVTKQAVRLAKKILKEPETREEMVNTNYEIARRNYSYRALRWRLKALIADCLECRYGAN